MHSDCQYSSPSKDCTASKLAVFSSTPTMRNLLTLSTLPLFLTTALALPYPFHRCHKSTPTSVQPIEDLERPLPTGALIAGVLTDAPTSQIASLIQSNRGDFGGEIPVQRRRRRPHAELFEEDALDFGEPVVKIRRSLWNLLGWREWIVSIEWNVPAIPRATFKLEREERLRDVVGWEREEFVRGPDVGGERVQERQEMGMGDVMLDL